MLKIYQDPTPETLDELLLHAGDEDNIPAEPHGGIPRQHVPGWIRWPLRLLFLPLIILDLYMQRVARLFIKTPFKQVGQCKKRGNCCHYILIPANKGFFGMLFYFWNTEILGFYKRSNKIYESEKKQVYVMGCRYLKKDGSCAHYRLRPAVCRKWPMIEYFGYPRILKGCGFKPVYRDRPEEEVQ